MEQRLSGGTREDTSHKGDGNNRLQRIAREQIPGRHTQEVPTGRFSTAISLCLDIQATVTFILTLAPRVLFSYLHTSAHTILLPWKLSLFLHDSQRPRCSSRLRQSSSCILSCACLWDALAHPHKEGSTAQLQGGGQLSPSGSASVARSWPSWDHEHLGKRAQPFWADGTNSTGQHSLQGPCWAG